MKGTNTLDQAVEGREPKPKPATAPIVVKKPRKPRVAKPEGTIPDTVIGLTFGDVKRTIFGNYRLESPMLKVSVPAKQWAKVGKILFPIKKTARKAEAATGAEPKPRKPRAPKASS